MAIIKNKAVVKLGVKDAESKKAAIKGLKNLDESTSFTLDFEKSTLVVIGDIDPIVLVHRLRKFVSTNLVTFGPEKDEGKSQKNDGGGGNVDQKQKQQPQKQPQPQPVYRPYDGYGYGYGYGNNNYY